MSEAPSLQQPLAGDPARLASALHYLRVGITLFDADGRLIFANLHLNHIFRGLPPCYQLLGRFYRDIVWMELPEIAPVALSAGVDAFIARRLAQLQAPAAPMDLPLADGRIFEIRPRPDGHGGAVLLWTDVTQARHHFARLEAAIRLSADAFAFYDEEDRFVTGNALYAQLSGQPLSALKGKSFEAILTEIVAAGRLALTAPAEEWIARRLRGHRQHSSADTLTTAAGRAFLVRDCATPDGGRVMVFTDITEKTRAETALAEAQRALEHTRDEARRQSGYLADLTRRLDRASAQADHAKTMLLRTMSHELKTPLNAILGFSELMTALAGRLSANQVREYAGLIHQGGSNLLKMLTHIMDLTKISAGRYDLRKAPLDVGRLLWQARQDHLARAEARHIAILAEDGPALLLEADEGVVSEMLTALLDNALTFTPEGGTVTLTAARATGGVRLAVADNGPGVAAEDLERILQPFEHAGGAQDHAKGAGLGLTLVKAFAELHGGSLAIDSAPGRGFTASIFLPF